MLTKRKVYFALLYASFRIVISTKVIVTHTEIHVRPLVEPKTSMGAILTITVNVIGLKFD